MKIEAAAGSDIEAAVSCWAAAFASDPITQFLLEAGAGYHERTRQFFSLLVRARIALAMPVIAVRDSSTLVGAAMGYDTTRPPWPAAIAQDWDRFEKSIPGIGDRMAVYDGIAAENKPSAPHYYLGVIGTDPARQGLGIGTRLLASFCALSAADPLSDGVYLETASPTNVPFYERAGFEVTGVGALGGGTLWCMFLRHGAGVDGCRT